MKLVVCDEDKIFLKRVGRILEECTQKGSANLSLKMFVQSEELIKYCEENNEMDMIILVTGVRAEGIESAKRIRKYNKEVKIVFLTQYEESKNGFIEKNGKNKSRIYFSDLIYIETCGRKTKLHMKNKEIISTRSMKEHMTLLNAKQFKRCHAAYIVNMDYIEEIKGMELWLSNGDRIPVSKGKRKEFMESYLKYI